MLTATTADAPMAVAAQSLLAESQCADSESSRRRLRLVVVEAPGGIYLQALPEPSLDPIDTSLLNHDDIIITAL